jgi:hypothetical protein
MNSSYLNLKIKTAIVCCLLFMFTCGKIKAQESTFGQGKIQSKQYYEEIDFELLHDKIVLPVTINNKVYKFLLDTGAPNVISERLIKEIKSKKGVIHFRRWNILTLPWFSIYIHGIYMHDLDKHCHNHPWNIWTMVLWGSYYERLLNKDYVINYRRIFNMSYRNSEQFHKILKLKSKKVYTLAIVGKRKSTDWGYLTESGFVDFKTYRKK